MARITKFEDIQAWQKAREWVKSIYCASNSGSFAKDFGLRDQIRRAAVSVILNIAEGFARKTNREFSQFLVVAHGSAAEVQGALYVALDQNYITSEQFDMLYGSVDETSKMIMGFSTYLNKFSKSGTIDGYRNSKTPQTPQTQKK